MSESYRTCLVAHHDNPHHHIQFGHFAYFDSLNSSIDHRMAHSNVAVPQMIDDDAVDLNYDLVDSNCLFLFRDKNHGRDYQIEA